MSSSVLRSVATTTTTTTPISTTSGKKTTTTRTIASTASVSQDMLANYQAVSDFFHDIADRGSPLPALLKDRSAGDDAAALGQAALRLHGIFPKSYAFARAFQQMEAEVQKPVRVKEPVPPVHLLVVTITMSHEMAYREVHRRTWMSRPGVCRLNASALEPPAGCRLYATFAVGSVGGDGIMDAEVDEEARRHGDVVRVNATDPQPLYVPVEGRQFVPLDTKARQKEKDSAVLLFFRRHWPWATFVGKMDLDNHPRIDNILADLQLAEQERVTGEAPGGSGAPVFYGELMGEDSKGLRGFMQGQFYAMSRVLLDCLMDQLFGSGKRYPRDYAIRNRNPPCSGVGYGDTMVGCFVKTWTYDRQTCPAPRWVNVRKTTPRWHLRKP